MIRLTEEQIKLIYQLLIQKTGGSFGIRDVPEMETGDILTSGNGKPIAGMSSPKTSATSRLSGILKGKVPSDIDRHTLKKSRFEEA